MNSPLSSQDYSPFGVTLEGRSWSAGYRYGFQNQETDEELWDGAINYKYRVEYARLGRFFSVDPLFKQYPYNSNYAFSENRVIDSKEIEGLEKLYFANKKVTIDISTMSSDQVEKMVEENGFNWDTDWYDANAKGEVWSLYNCVNSYGDGTGTRIDKYSSQSSKDSKKSQAYFSDIDRTLLEWAAAMDETLDETDGYKTAGPMVFAALGTIFSAGTLVEASGLWSIMSSSISLAVSADELTTGLGANQKTFLSDLANKIGGETGEKLFNGAKLACNVRDATKGLINLTVTLSDGSSINGVYDALNDVYNITDVSIKVAETTNKQNSNDGK